MADLSEKCRIGGYISVRTVLEAGTREVYGLLLDKKRIAKVKESAFHLPEKRQYAALERITAARGIPVEYVTEENFAACGGSDADGGIAAYVGNRCFSSDNEALEAPVPFTVLLDGIEDPYNFGYILRTLYAAGADWVVLPRRNFFTASEIVIRASAGASELLLTIRQIFAGVLPLQGAISYLRPTVKMQKIFFRSVFGRPCVWSSEAKSAASPKGCWRPAM